MTDLTKYVLVPYEEYQYLISIRKQLEIDKEYEIYLRPLKDFLWKELELSVRSLRVLTNIIDGKFSLSKRSKVYQKYEYPNRPEDVIGRFKKFQFVGDMVSKSDYDMMFLAEFGRKSFNELKEQFKQYELRSGIKLEFYTKLPESVEEKLNKLRELIDC